MKKSFEPISVVALVLAASCTFAQGSKPSWQVEWEKTVELGKKEGGIVAGIPASAKLRKMITEAFKARYPEIDLELIPSRGPANANRILSEHKGGIRYFDLLISGTSTPFGLVNAGVLEPLEPLMVLPEVTEANRWFAGHIWLDNTRRFVYSFQAYQSENLWYNASIMKPEEVCSYDDLLNPKWKGKLGFLDQRTPGAGTSTWAFLWKLKGEGYLRKLVGQGLLLSRDQRQLAESLGKGNIALTVIHQLRRGKKVRRDPAEYFREGRLYVACEADEDINYVVSYIGEDSLVVASDYPHGDPSHEENMVQAIMQREDVPLRMKEKILSDNPQGLYRL